MEGAVHLLHLVRQIAYQRIALTELQSHDSHIASHAHCYAGMPYEVFRGSGLSCSVCKYLQRGGRYGEAQHYCGETLTRQLKAYLERTLALCSFPVCAVPLCVGA